MVPKGQFGMVPKGIELSHSLCDSFGISQFGMVPKVVDEMNKCFGTSQFVTVPKGTTRLPISGFSFDTNLINMISKVSIN